VEPAAPGGAGAAGARAGAAGGVIASRGIKDVACEIYVIR
jgi:hypothetical protein